MNRIDDIKSNWTQLGKLDPYWSVLTNPKYKDNKWEKHDFYKSGESQFNRILHDFGNHLKMPYSKVVDFGCGPGRLTFQLAKIADEVIGIDISEPMIKLARSTNMFNKKCRFIINAETNLRLIESDSIDLIFSFITLQHNPPKIIYKYFDEFVRISSKESGQILFNLVSSPPIYYRILHYLLGQHILNKIRRVIYRKNSAMEMNWIRSQRVITYFRKREYKLIKVINEKSAGIKWNSKFYLFEHIGCDTNK